MSVTIVVIILVFIGSVVALLQATMISKSRDIMTISSDDSIRKLTAEISTRAVEDANAEIKRIWIKQVSAVIPLEGRYTYSDGKLFFEFGEDSVIICGRSRKANLMFEPMERTISSYHFRLINRGENWIIEDLDSKNGTYVNNKIISSPVRANLGDTIRAGNVEMELIGCKT